jgi:hypothetical protein
MEREQYDGLKPLSRTKVLEEAGVIAGVVDELEDDHETKHKEAADLKKQIERKVKHLRDVVSAANVYALKGGGVTTEAPDPQQELGLGDKPE